MLYFIQILPDDANACKPSNLSSFVAGIAFGIALPGEKWSMQVIFQSGLK
jgi:hypothetical protein